MAQDAEFEEKEYEGPLNQQLLNGSKILWSPGQVFEKRFGIDSAMKAADIYLWKLFGMVEIPDGIVLRSYNWHSTIGLEVSKKKKLPTFKVNLLLQAKRPAHRNGTNPAYSRFGIKKEYWQFQIRKKQQSILEKLEEKLGSDALVTYGCAAFHTLDDLFNNIEKESLVKRSTFVKPSKLKGHRKWAYDRPGNSGIGCSKIERIEGEDFSQGIESLGSIAANSSDDEETVLENLINLERIALEISKEENDKNSITREFIKRRNRMIKSLESTDATNLNIEAIRSFLSFGLLTSLLNLTWWTV